VSEITVTVYTSAARINLCLSVKIVRVKVMYFFLINVSFAQTKNGRDTKNICHRVTQARKIIGPLNGVWWSKNITRNRKKMIHNSMVKSVLIYGAETWSLYEDDRRRINVTEMDALRRSARISKLDRKTNEYIRGKMDVQDMILDDITRKQLI